MSVYSDKQIDHNHFKNKIRMITKSSLTHKTMKRHTYIKHFGKR